MTYLERAVMTHRIMAEAARPLAVRVAEQWAQLNPFVRYLHERNQRNTFDLSTSPKKDDAP
jgi:hypothetical protein